MKRVIWTSGVNSVDATLRMGHDRPVCGSAWQARTYAAEGENLYRITVEEYTLDPEEAMRVYLQSLDPETPGPYVPRGPYTAEDTEEGWGVFDVTGHPVAGPDPNDEQGMKERAVARNREEGFGDTGWQDVSRDT